MTSDTEQLRRRNRELSILKTISEELNRSIELDQALQTVLAKVAELLDLQTGWIWLQDPDLEDTYLAAAQNLPPALANNPHLMEGTCYCLDTFHAGDMAGAANINVITCSRLKRLVDGTDGLRYHASVPLYVHGSELGVLNVASADWRELTEDDLRILYTVGDLLSISIERARLFNRSSEMGALEERNRLAREIHDTLAQDLAGIALQLETADAMLESGSDADKIHDTVRQALELTRASLEDARRSVLDLRAAPLEGRSLADALVALSESAGSSSGIDITCVVQTGEDRLSARLETGLYRLAQEALSNISRHSNASAAQVRFSTHDQQAILEVEDNGRGFDPGDLPEGRFGLVGMNERVKLLGGHMDLTSSPGRGTRIKITVPQE
ncbi:MAG: GAF domain-containing sensor histidine kinase [Candidatus Promineifilaceae bacterium]|nr:GAF domain-containing sensor histidine kinase [Candidatus Promineifilaceae bacterium]